MRWIANFVYLLAGLFYLPVALYQAVVVGKNRRGWAERFGFVRQFDRTRRRIWIHAVSLGEINATPRLVEQLQERLPDFDIVFSTTTDTGYARAVRLYGAKRVFRFPLDFSPVIGRVLRRVRPSMIVLVELEVWFNLVSMARRRGLPVAVVNGRLTERSARRFRRLGPIARSMFRHLSWVGAQDETIAERFRELGTPADRVTVTSSLKWDTAETTGKLNGTDALAKAVGIDGSRPVWVCGSSGPGEEAIILDAHQRLLRDWLRADKTSSQGKNAAEGTSPLLVIVPRRPERFDEVARLIGGSGFTCVRRSKNPDGTPGATLSTKSVVLGDTMGELRKFYSLANVVFIGRSLVPMGGSDPMEVAALGKPIVVGPHTENFRMPIDALGRSGALRVVESAEALHGVLASLLKNEEVARQLGQRARQTVVDNQGSTTRTVDAIVRLL